MADKTLQATIKLRDEMTKVLSDINKNLSDFQDEITLANDSLNDTEKALGGTKNGFDDFGECTDRAADGVKIFNDTLNGMALQEVGSKITELGKKMIDVVGQVIDTSSELNAEIAQQEFIYSNLDKTVQRAIDNGSKQARTLGMTNQQYKNIATGIDSYYKNMGLANNEIAKMSSKTMTLASDMAAMVDVPVEEAARDFKSAMMGNYEALDKYNINISAACLENSKYVKSLGKSWNQLSDNEKLMAVYNEAMRQSSDYTGLGAQEATEFAAQWRLLKQDVKEATYELGNGLLPVLAPMVQSIGEAARAVGEWAKEHPKLAQVLMIVIASVGALLLVGGSLLTFLGMATVAIGAVSAAGGIMAVVFSPITLTILAVAAAMGILVGAGVSLYNNWDMVCQKATELKNWVIDQFNILRNQCTDAINIMNDSISNAWDSIVEKFQTSVESATSWWNNLTSTISNNPIKAVVDFVKPAFTGSNSHAYGLNKVPYDGYTAKLHQGERVLTASEARRQDNNSGNGVTIAKIADTVIIREEADINKIANEFARKLKSAQLTQA